MAIYEKETMNLAYLSIMDKSESTSQRFGQKVTKKFIVILKS